MSQHYFVETVTTRPDDLGYSAVCRERCYHCLIHKQKGRFLGKPGDVYAKISEQLKNYKDVLIESLFWETDPDELKKEALSAVTASRMGEYDPDDWSGFLTSWELDNLSTYKKMYQEKYGDMQDAIFVLNQNPTKHKSWTIRKGDEPSQLPTLCLGQDNIDKVDRPRQTHCPTFLVSLFSSLYG